MNIIPAQEIKRKGIAAVDEALMLSPVHVIKNNRPQYVVLTESSYQALLESQQELTLSRIKASLEDVIRAADLSSKSYLETEAEVEEYLAKLRVELLAAIKAGQRARIQ